MTYTGLDISVDTESLHVVYLLVTPLKIHIKLVE